MLNDVIEEMQIKITLRYWVTSTQFSSVAQSCLTLFDPH